MNEMTSRQRVLTVLNHKEADFLPLDLGVAKSCRFSKGMYAKLIKYFGLDESVIIGNKISQTASPSDKLLEILGVDVRTNHTPFLAQNRPGSDWEDDTGYYYRNDWDALYKMPKSNPLYYDIVAAPLRNTEFDDDIDLKYVMPDPPVLDLNKVSIAKNYQDAGYAFVFGEHFGNGFFQSGPVVYGFQQWLSMLITEPERVEAFNEKLLERKIKHWENVFSVYGDTIDVICEADDLSTQHGPFVSKAVFNRLIAPYYRRLYDYIHSHSKAKVFLHSCGAVSSLIPSLIDLGIDILNPVQITAENMDPVMLKREFGRDIVFWGGGIATQTTLPHGTPQQVRDEVKRNIDIFAKDGGFIFTPVHNMQQDIPIENFIAMWETYQENKKY